MKIEKPCRKLKYCPYGILVEHFKLRKKRNNKYSCIVYGHDCPVFSCAENFADKKRLIVKKRAVEYKS